MTPIMKVLWQDVKNTVGMFFLFTSLFVILSLPLIFMNWLWPEANTDGKVVITILFWLVVAFLALYVEDVRGRANSLRYRDEDYR